MRAISVVIALVLWLGLPAVPWAAPSVPRLPNHATSAKLKAFWSQRVHRPVHNASTAIRNGCRVVWCRLRGKDPDPITRVHINHRAIGDWSTWSLIVSAANEAVTLGKAAGPIAAPLAGLGGAGLFVHSTRNFVKADNAEQRWDASHGIAWGLQGIGVLGKMVQSRGPSWVAPTSTVLGAAGGTVQVCVGARRIVTGIRDKKLPRVLLGCLDVGAGACWAVTSCTGDPYSLAGFATFAGLRWGYAAYLRKKAERAKQAQGGTAASQAPGPQPPEEPPAVIVTDPAPPKVIAKALKGPGTELVRDENGRAAGVATKATATTSSGKLKPAVVVTPLDLGDKAARKSRDERR